MPSITVNVFKDPLGNICITDEEETFCLTLKSAGKGKFSLCVDKMGVLQQACLDEFREDNQPIVATQKHQAAMEIAIRAYGHARELGDLKLLA